MVVLALSSSLTTASVQPPFGEKWTSICCARACGGCEWAGWHAVRQQRQTRAIKSCFRGGSLAILRTARKRGDTWTRGLETVKLVAEMPQLDPQTLDDGIRETVLSLRKAGYKTFTSCEGGRGHAFREPTIGLKVQGDYFRFRDRLAKFLHSQGRSCFEVVLFSCYHHKTPQGKHHAYLQGFDIVSPEKRKKLIRSSRQKERRTIARLLKELA